MDRIGRMARAIGRWALIAVSTYVLVCAVAAWRKEELVFPDHGRVRAEGRVAPVGYATWWLTMRDGVRVEGWWLPAARRDREAPAVIVFHGNGELIDDSRDFAEVWTRLGVHVLLAEYRGYGRSEGAPRIQSCIEDALEWYDRVAAEPGVRRDGILTHGFSLGGVFAAELAARRPVAGLILEGTVASLRDAAWDRGLGLVLTRERFDAKAALQGLGPDIPVVLTHGRSDGVVPFRHLALLAEARPQARVVIGDHDHYPLSTQSRPDLLRDLMVAALASRNSRPVVSGGDGEGT